MTATTLKAAAAEPADDTASKPAASGALLRQFQRCCLGEGLRSVLWI
jgi:hypothetical protein